MAIEVAKIVIKSVMDASGLEDCIGAGQFTADEVVGVIGKTESLTDESFEGGLLEYPHYTRPETWRGKAVPELLLSGHHERIQDWRREAAERITRERRPDLWARYQERMTAVKD